MLEADVALGARPLIGEVLLASKQLETFKSLVKKAKNSKPVAFLIVLVRPKKFLKNFDRRRFRKILASRDRRSSFRKVWNLKVAPIVSFAFRKIIFRCPVFLIKSCRLLCLRFFSPFKNVKYDLSKLLWRKESKHLLCCEGEKKDWYESNKFLQLNLWAMG